MLRKIADVGKGDCGFVPFSDGSPEWKNPSYNAPADIAASIERLRRAARDFTAHRGSLQPHFAYGALDKDRYELAHAMHLANHFSAFQPA